MGLKLSTQCSQYKGEEKKDGCRVPPATTTTGDRVKIFPASPRSRKPSRGKRRQRLQLEHPAKSEVVAGLQRWMGRSRREVGQRKRSQMRKPALVRRKRRRKRRKRMRTEKKRKRRKMERRIEGGVQIQILALDLPQEICILVRTFIWSFLFGALSTRNNDFSFCCHSLNSICYNN